MVNDSSSIPTRVLDSGDTRDVVVSWCNSEGASVNVCARSLADLPYETPDEAWWRGMLAPDTLDRLKALKGEPPEETPAIDRMTVKEAIKIALAVGKSHAAAAARLNRSGYRTPQGKEFTAQTLRRAKRRLVL